MNEFIFQIGSSNMVMLLLKVTLVLTIGWIGHSCLNPIHAKWRCRLWRFGAILLVTALILNFVPSPLKIAIERNANVERNSSVAIQDHVSDQEPETNLLTPEEFSTPVVASELLNKTTGKQGNSLPCQRLN